MANEVSTAVVVSEPPKVVEPSGLVALAVERGYPVDVLERLVALQERVTQQNAEGAMAQALAKFQEECPPIRRVKTAEVTKDGRKQYEYKFAPLEEIATTIRPVLARHGLSYSHDATLHQNAVEVVCTLLHVEGAKRTATFRGPIDASGGKNPIQQVASARSYGRRYSLIDVLGLTTEDDDDGRAAGDGGDDEDKVTDSQAADLRALMREVKADEGKFLRWLKVGSVEDLPAARYREAVTALEQKRRPA